MKVGIVSQRDNERAVSLADRLVDRLAENAVDVAIDESTAAALAAEFADDDGGDDAGAEAAGEGAAGEEAAGEGAAGDGTAGEHDHGADSGQDSAAEPAVPLPGTPTEEMTDCDLVVSIGGDGTFLYTARSAGTTPVLGVNLGEVGFLNAVSPGDAIPEVLEEVRRIREGRARTQELPRLVATAGERSLEPGLNEVLVQGPRRGHAGGAEFEVRVDGDDYTSGHADGVLVATPTGSTAYNLSEGGPLVHPSVPALVVTEMAGGDGARPLLVDVDSEVTIAVADAEEAVVVSDGRARERIVPPAEVAVGAAAEPARVAGPARDFFGALGKLE